MAAIKTPNRMLAKKPTAPVHSDPTTGPLKGYRARLAMLVHRKSFLPHHLNVNTPIVAIASSTIRPVPTPSKSESGLVNSKTDCNST